MYSILRPLGQRLVRSKVVVSGPRPRYASSSGLVSLKFKDIPVPPLPPALPTTETAPILENPEGVNYLKPLYNRSWGVHAKRHFTVDADGKLVVYTPCVLARKFVLSSPENAANFLNKVLDTMVEEGHQPNMFSIDGQAVNLYTTTTNVDRPWRKDVVDALTIRDIRLAVRAETLFDEEVRSGRAIPKMTIPARRPEVRSLKIAQDAASPRALSTLKPTPISEEEDPLPLPAKPPIPDPRVPIEDADFEPYMKPLYTRGWAINLVPRYHASEPSEPRIVAPRLTKKFAFQDPTAAIEFSKAAIKAGVDQSTDFTAVVSENTVRLYTTTELKPTPASIKTTGIHTSTWCISYIDIRTAIRLENIAQRHIDKVVKGPSILDALGVRLRPGSVAELDQARAEFMRELQEKKKISDLRRRKAKSAVKAGGEAKPKVETKEQAVSA